jgi:hypothetical protein
MIVNHIADLSVISAPSGVNVIGVKPEGLLATIALRALERKLPFLLAGGHAVVLHGVARNTFDLDLIIRREDRAPWFGLLQDLGYALFNQSPTFLQLTAPDARNLPVDLMLVEAGTFGKLLADAQPAPAETHGAKVVSLFHLLALKCHAVKYGHRARIEKDVDDIIGLVRVNHLDVNRPELRSLILHHGTQELYEKLRLAR